MTSGGRPTPEQGSWQIPGHGAPGPDAHRDPYRDGYGTGSAPAGTPVPPPAGARWRGRPGLVALVVAVLELVIIAAVGNQSVSAHAERCLLDHSNTFAGRVVGSTLSFTWRFTPQKFDNRDGFHVYAEQLVNIAVFVLVSALLTAVVVRAASTFWTVLLGVWAAVLLADWASHVLSALVTKSPSPRSRATFAVFESVTGLTLFAGAVLGLLAGLVGALVAVSTRRTVTLAPAAPPVADPAPYRTPEAPPPFYGPPPRREDTWATTALPRHDAASDPAGEHTAALPAEPERRPDEPDGRTTQLPRFDPGGGRHWQPPAGDERTQGMPAQQDDER